MTVGSISLGAASVAADEDDVGLLAVSYPAINVNPLQALLTRVAAPGTVSVDEASAIRGEARGGRLTGKPSPTKITGA